MNSRWFTCLLAGGVWACTGAEDTGEAVVQLEGPSIEHTPPTTSVASGESLVLEALATDEDGVRAVTVYYRTAGSTYWDSRPLELADDIWQAELADLEAPGLEYYFKASDDGEPVATSYLPEEATADPFALNVLASTFDLPWSEDFELAEGESSLFTLDWWTPTDGFTGYAWEVTYSDAYGGESSAVHESGSPEVGELSDWLISPALNFASLDQIMVRWMERGSLLDSFEGHGLYLSTGSRSPEDGDFVAVEDALPVPESEWARSASYDLSEWAGEPVVYLAWKYVGTDADQWWIDDVEVLELAPDLHASLGWAPNPVHPGESVSLTIALDNHTEAEATGLTGTLSLPDGGGTIVEPDVAVESIDGFGSHDLYFALELDPELHDNRALPLRLELTDGIDSWGFDLEMIVGLPSEAIVTLSLDEDASLQWILGVGDPDDPTWVTTAHAGQVLAGTQTLSLDITDAYEWLPPEAGPLRWFSKLSADVDGSVDSFEIWVGGESHAASRLYDFAVDEAALMYIPEPPDFQVIGVSPGSAEPGQSAVTPTLTLYNQGEATVGPVTGVLYSLDGNATVLDSANFSVSSSIFSGLQTTVVETPMISVDENHTDSTPLKFEVELTDGLETWFVEFDLPVPWPVLKITRVEIDDSGGDGILDPGETATLEIEVTNTGDLSTTGTVSGVLSVADSSTATTSLLESEGYFGSMYSGTSRDDDDFELDEVTGEVGDSLDLLLTLTDDEHVFEVSLQLVLGTPTWQSLNAMDDDVGDALDEYDFDIVNGQVRVVDGTIEMVLESAEPYDPTTLFLEAWGQAAGSDYLYYRWVLQAGSATFQGYDASDGFLTIGSMDVDFVDDTHVMLSWLAEDMALFSNDFSIGWASGWCGPDEYYCDHFPNGWGYPYVSFSTSGWFDVSW